MSVRTVGNSQILCLSRDTFNRILGSIKKYLKEDYVNKEKFDGSYEDEDDPELSIKEEN